MVGIFTVELSINAPQEMSWKDESVGSTLRTRMASDCFQLSPMVRVARESEKEWWGTIRNYRCLSLR